MNITQGSFVVVGANTPEAKVFWNGQEVENLGFVIRNDINGQKVTIYIKEDPIIAELKSAGINVVRSI